MAELSKIQTNTTWSDAANVINNNNDKINAELTSLKSSTTNFKGYFTDISSLQSAFPNPKDGQSAWVGSPYPGTVYKANSGSWTNTSEVPSVPEVELNDYYDKMQVDSMMKLQDDNLKESIAELECEIGIVQLESGSIDASTGEYIINNKRVRTNKILGSFSFEIKDGVSVTSIVKFNEDGSYESLPLSTRNIEKDDNAGYVIIALKKDSEEIINNFDLNDFFEYFDFSIKKDILDINEKLEELTKEDESLDNQIKDVENLILQDDYPQYEKANIQGWNSLTVETDIETEVFGYNRIADKYTIIEHSGSTCAYTVGQQNGKEGKVVNLNIMLYSDVEFNIEWLVYAGSDGQYEWISNNISHVKVGINFIWLSIKINNGNDKYWQFYYTNHDLVGQIFYSVQYTYYGSRKILFLQNDKIEQKEIENWGDSLTAMGYPEILQEKTGIKCHNYGYAGYKSTYIRDKFIQMCDKNKIQIIWVGRNNYSYPDVVIEDIQMMVRHLNTPYFLIISVLNGGYGTFGDDTGYFPSDGTQEMCGGWSYNAIDYINTWLKKEYPSNFLDIREALIRGWNMGNIRLLSPFVKPEINGTVHINVSDANFLVNYNTSDLGKFGQDFMENIRIGTNRRYDKYKVISKDDNTHLTVQLIESNYEVSSGETIDNLIDDGGDNSIIYLKIMQECDYQCLRYDTTLSTFRKDGIHMSDDGTKFMVEILIRKLISMNLINE